MTRYCPLTFVHSEVALLRNILRLHKFIFKVLNFRDEVLHYLRNIARDSSKTQLDQNIPTQKKSKV